MAENWANTPAKAAIPPTPPARRQSSYGQSKNTRNHLEGIYADIANKVTDPISSPFSSSLNSTSHLLTLSTFLPYPPSLFFLFTFNSTNAQFFTSSLLYLIYLL